jgi:hypothetical protein
MAEPFTDRRRAQRPQHGEVDERSDAQVSLEQWQVMSRRSASSAIDGVPKPANQAGPVTLDVIEHPPDDSSDRIFRLDIRSTPPNSSPTYVHSRLI